MFGTKLKYTVDAAQQFQLYSGYYTVVVWAEKISLGQRILNFVFGTNRSTERHQQIWIGSPGTTWARVNRGTTSHTPCPFELRKQLNGAVKAFVNDPRSMYQVYA